MCYRCDVLSCYTWFTNPYEYYECAEARSRHFVCSCGGFERYLFDGRVICIEFDSSDVQRHASVADSDGYSWCECRSAFSSRRDLLAQARGRSAYPWSLSAAARPTILLAVVFMLLPVQGVAGALVLNNGGSNGLAIATAVEAVILIAGVLTFRRRLDCQFVYPAMLVSLSCAILLMLSMRSNYVFGWDINEELYVMNLTLLHAHWSFAAFQDPYNSCLSLTVFPVGLSALTGIHGVLLLKLVYPVLFSLSTLALYTLFSRFVGPTLACLAALLIIAQPEYVNEIAMLARQEIALLFVAAAYLVLFAGEKLQNRVRKLLFMLLTASIIVSHYSTSYIFILSLCGMYMWQRAMSYRRRGLPASSDAAASAGSCLSLGVLLGCMMLVFVWNIQLAPLWSNLGHFAVQVTSNMGSFFRGDLRSQSLYSALWNAGNANPSNIVAKHFAKAATSYTAVAKAPPSIPAPLEGSLNIIKYVYPVVSTLLKICLVVGLFMLLRSTTRDSRTFLLQGACVSSVIGIVAFYLLPYVSLAYNFDRFALQGLFVLALPILFGLNYLARGLRVVRLPSVAVCTVVLLAYLVFPLGLAAEVLGGEAPVQFNNYGLLYSRFYAHSSEVAAIHWLGRQDAAMRTAIYADRYAATRFPPYASVSSWQINQYMMPPFARRSYVFASYSNYVRWRRVCADRQS